MKRTLIAAFTMMTAITLLAQPLSTEQKIEALLSKMTLTEKIGQMNQLTGLGLSGDMTHRIKEGRVGSILNEITLETVNELQRIAVEETRLGIPLIFCRDVVHGFKTIFPIPLGQAATWNPQIAYNGARVAALEATSVGIRWTFAPMIDVSRDPRWGRIAESCGEDPYLTSRMGEAMVKGFQTDDLTNPTAMAACAKHFAAYGASESGKDYSTTWVPEVQLRDVYFPPFEAAVKAGSATFMCSFNDINGVPSSGSQFLNKQVLRKEWNWDGVLVSDWGSIEQMIPHGYSANLKQAAEQAANAAVDVDMMGHAYESHLENLVAEGKVDIKDIDQMVRNVLRLKFRLNLFDQPYAKVHQAPYDVKAMQQAKEAALEGAVLLTNNGILPISPSIKSIAVVGPLANSGRDQVGTWCFDAEPKHSVTPLMDIKARYGSSINIIEALGLSYSREKNPVAVKKAVATASKADVVLFFAGEEAVLSGEARCRADISLPGDQLEMLKQLKSKGKRVILIIMAGRPLTIEQEASLADAVIYSFHGGTMAGPALIDLIFGLASPSGKLPVTLPKMVGQVPIYYNCKNTGRPSSDVTLIDDIAVGAEQTSIGFTSYHLDAGTGPLFPFGYGLSYTTFSYGPVVLSAPELSMDGKLVATCKITNTGKVKAQEVVQLYTRDLVGTLVRPIKELKGFQKISLNPGESKVVTFTILPQDLAYCHPDMVMRPEVGVFQLWIAPSSQSGEPVSFILQN